MGLHRAPDFQPYRLALFAVDPAMASMTFNQGMDAGEWSDVLVNLTLGGTGPPSATVEVLFWSVQAAAWVIPSTAIEFAMTAAGTIAFDFQALGRRFLLRLKAIAGTNETMTMEVAGKAREEDFD